MIATQNHVQFSTTGPSRVALCLHTSKSHFIPSIVVCPFSTWDGHSVPVLVPDSISGVVLTRRDHAAGIPNKGFAAI